MTDYTIANEFILPSKGKIYNPQINPQFKLRSMTTAEEMKRLNHSDRPYKAMSEVLDDCLVDKLGMSAYDLHISDYQFMVHKLRIVTYGPEYKIETTCPYCGSVNREVFNLDSINVVEYDADLYNKYTEFDLPSTGKRIKLRMQTPRVLDEISYKTKEARRRNPQVNGDPAFLFTLESLIDTVDDEKLEEFQLTNLVQKLPMADTNYILRAAQKLTQSFGMEGRISHTCSICGLDYNSTFRTTSEFFGPSID